MPDLRTAMSGMTGMMIAPGIDIGIGTIAASATATAETGIAMIGMSVEVTVIDAGVTGMMIELGVNH